MVALCCMLCLYVYGLRHSGQLNNICQNGFLFSSVLSFTIGNRLKIDVAAV